MALGCILAAGSTSCADPSPEPRAGHEPSRNPGFGALELSLAGARAPLPEPVSLGRFSADEALWESKGTAVEPVPSSDSSPGWRSSAGGPTRITWEVDCQRAELQRIVLHALTATPEQCTLELGSAGRFERVALMSPLLPREDRLVFEVPPGPQGRIDQVPQGRIDQVAIHTVGRSRELRVEAIELFSVPAAHALPTSLNAGWVNVHGEARRAHSLWVGETWGASFELQGPSRLMLGAALPPQASRASALVLEVTLEREGQLHEQRFDLRRLLARPLWHPIPLTLGPRDGPTWESGRVELRLSLKGEPGGVVAVETPIVDVPRRDADVVLLVTSDTHRADYLGSASPASPVRTPTLDALAQRGVAFADAYASSNFTVPSHSAILTGVHPRQTRVLGNSDALSGAALTLAERYRDAGYLCLAAVSAAHLDAVRSGLGQGFQRFASPEVSQRDSRATLKFVDRWLKDMHGRSLFIWVHAFDAHMPYLPPKEILWSYYPQEKDPKDPSLPELPKRRQPTWLRGVRDLDYVFASYAGEVTYFDQQLGPLLQHPLLASARIAVTADHGEALGEQDLWFGHGSVSPAILAVPLILAGPGLPEAWIGERLPRKVSNVDLGRTLLDWSGLRDASFPGRSLLDPDAQEVARFALASQGSALAMESDDWLLILHLVEREVNGRVWFSRHQVQLFDLCSDPRCERDLVEAELERARRMRRAALEFLLEGNQLDWRVEPRGEGNEDLIRALGYAGDSEARVEREWIDPDCDCSFCRSFGS